MDNEWIFEIENDPELDVIVSKGDKGDKGDKGYKGDKGDPGTPGRDGDDGAPGKDGHTPVITAEKDGTTTTIYADGEAIAEIEDGADGYAPEITAVEGDGVTTIYVDGIEIATINDGQDGQPGANGKDGKDGNDGQPGQDGHSPVVTASKSGKVTTISVDGTAIATINDGDDGQDGQDGQDGNDGYTPVKGTDYWTAEDKAEIVDDTLSELDYVVNVTMTDESTGIVDKTATEIVEAYESNKKVVFTGYLGDTEFIAPVSLVYKQTIQNVEYVSVQAYAVMIDNNSNRYFMTLIIPWNTGESTTFLLMQDALGEPDLSNYVQKDDYATANDGGVVKVYGNGLQMLNDGTIATSPATSAYIKSASASYSPIAPARQHEATFYGLAKAAGDTTQSASSNAVGTYTDDAKAAIQSMLGIGVNEVTVSGTTPTITADAGKFYICGEVTSISFTPSATGLCGVRFTSGSTVAILTLPNTVKMPDWWDGTLEANTVYEINIMDGIYGAVMAWT